jgi:hypothetical protein
VHGRSCRYDGGDGQHLPAARLPAFTNAGGAGDVSTNTQILNAVLGTVDNAGVASEDSAAETNIEGAEATTGGTGTRTS